MLGVVIIQIRPRSISTGRTGTRGGGLGAQPGGGSEDKALEPVGCVGALMRTHRRFRRKRSCGGQEVVPAWVAKSGVPKCAIGTYVTILVGGYWHFIRGEARQPYVGSH